MKRLTTDNPMSTLETCLNLCFAKDGEAWVRGYGEKGADITLNDLTRIIIERFGLDISPGIEPYDDLPQNMYESLEDGLTSMEGITALMYCFSWVAAELRERLKQYEDLGSIGELEEMKFRLEGLEK